MREKSARGLPPAADPAGIALPCSTWNEADGFAAPAVGAQKAGSRAEAPQRLPSPSRPRAVGCSATPGTQARAFIPTEG